MIVNYKRDLNHSYLILDEKAMDSKEYFQLQMLTKNQIAGLLNLNISMFNGENSLQYDISSKQNLLCIYDQKVITEKDMEIFLFSIQEMLKRIENYLLDPDYLLLNPEFMYLNISENQLEFCFYPCEKNDIRESIRIFSEYLLNRIDHQVEKVVALAYKFYRLTRDPNFNYEAIIEELFGTPENNAGFDKLSSKYTVSEYGETGHGNFGDGNVKYRNVGCIDSEYMEEDNGEDKYSVSQEEYDEIDTESSIRENQSGRLRHNIKGRSNHKKGTSRITAHLFFGVLFILSILFIGYKIAICFFLEEELVLTSELILAAGFIVIGIVGMVISSTHNKMLLKTEKEEKILEEKMEKRNQEEFLVRGAHQYVDNMDKSMDRCEETVLLKDNVYREEKILVGKQRGKKTEIAITKNPFLIGKKEDMVDFVLEDHSISRIHAKITQEEGRLYVTDLNSTNGTFKNGIQIEIQEKVLLEAEDEIKFGKLSFTYH